MNAIIEVIVDYSLGLYLLEGIFHCFKVILEQCRQVTTQFAVVGIHAEDVQEVVPKTDSPVKSQIGLLGALGIL